MQIQQYFSEDYVTARTKFVAACHLEGVEPERWVNPAAAPDGVELSTEVAYFGDPSAEKLLVLISGVHGVEALCGAGCQTGLIARGIARELPRDIALLVVHVINCWGAVHLRRNTDGNVDLCRNFMDFGQPLPTHPTYDEIHAAVSCPDLEGPRRLAAEALLEQFRGRHGAFAYMKAIMGGQYDHPDGFSYGGREPVWSNRTITAILEKHARRARQVALVEYHTGLGSYGYGMAVTMHTGAAHDRARRWYGEWILAPNQREPQANEETYRVRGHSTEGYLRILPAAEVTSIVLEYGTYPVQVMLPVMMADHRLHHHGDPGSPLWRQTKQRLLSLHYPADPDWRQAIWDRSQQVVAQSLRGLAAR